MSIEVVTGLRRGRDLTCAGITVRARVDTLSWRGKGTWLERCQARKPDRMFLIVEVVNELSKSATNAQRRYSLAGKIKDE